MSQSHPVTQIIYLEIAPSIKLKDDGSTWSKILSTLQDSPGFQKLYWGRSRERPELVHVHVIRTTMKSHQDFQTSPSQKTLETHLQQLTSTPPLYRHAQLKQWDAKNPYEAPWVGTAIYLNTTAAWHEGAWPLWTHIVRPIDGCLGGTGGPLLEPISTTRGPITAQGSVETVQQSAIVFVGWESVEKHARYHHTRHFREHGVVLTCGNDGFAEYGHVWFEGARVGGRKGEGRL